MRNRIVPRGGYIMKYIGFDFGTTNLRIMDEEQILFDEPFFVAYNSDDILDTIGYQAKELHGKHPILEKDEKMIRDSIQYLSQTYRLFRFLNKYGIVFTCCDKEIAKIIIDAFHTQGATQVLYEEELWAAVIGTQVNIESNQPTCVAYFGATSCDIGVFSNDECLEKSHTQIGGQAIGNQLRQWFKQHYEISISDQTIVDIIEQVGQCSYQSNPKMIWVHGFDLRSQQRKTVPITENQFVQINEPVFLQWAQWIYTFLSSLSAMHQQQIVLKGMICTGGVMRLNNLTQNLQEKLRLPIYCASDPEDSVCVGLQEIMDQL